MKNRSLTFVLIMFLLPVSISNAADKVVVIPLTSPVGKNVGGKIWGEGRIGIGLTQMSDGTGGICQTPAGINFAISNHISDWNSAASVCPTNTWVCRESDVNGQMCNTNAFRSLPISEPVVTDIQCDGTVWTTYDSFWVRAWLADAVVGSPELGKYRPTDSSFPGSGQNEICKSFFVWCCWK